MPRIGFWCKHRYRLMSTTRSRINGLKLHQFKCHRCGEICERNSYDIWHPSKRVFFTSDSRSLDHLEEQGTLTISRAEIVRMYDEAMANGSTSMCVLFHADGKGGWVQGPYPATSTKVKFTA